MQTTQIIWRFSQTPLSKSNTYQLSLEKAARGIDLFMVTDKTEFIYFKQDWAISTLVASL